MHRKLALTPHDTTYVLHVCVYIYEGIITTLVHVYYISKINDIEKRKGERYNLHVHIYLRDIKVAYSVLPHIFYLKHTFKQKH